MTKKELIIRIDEPLKREFKKTCAAHGNTMTDVVSDSIKKYIADKNKKYVY
jgi:antitoxin component of RelBE/YafQ-DinJ toxin-antitoxin module